MNIVIFDLDGTCIDSAHRQSISDDGVFNLEYWMENNTPNNIQKDTLLPLAKEVNNRRNRGDFVVFCTSRVLSQADYDFFVTRNLYPHHILCRRADDLREDGALKFSLISDMLKSIAFVKIRSVIMFDDSKSVRQALRSVIDCVIHPNKVNYRRV